MGMAAMFLSDTKELISSYLIVQTERIWPAVMLVLEDLREGCHDFPWNPVSHSFTCHNICVNTYQNGEFSALSELKMNCATVLHIFFFLSFFFLFCISSCVVLHYMFCIIMTWKSFYWYFCSLYCKDFFFLGICFFLKDQNMNKQDVKMC